MWARDHRRVHERKCLRCPNDRTDAEWPVVAPLLAPAKRGGRPRHVAMRERLSTVFYVPSTGSQRDARPRGLPQASHHRRHPRHAAERRRPSRHLQIAMAPAACCATRPVVSLRLSGYTPIRAIAAPGRTRSWPTPEPGSWKSSREPNRTSSSFCQSVGSSSVLLAGSLAIVDWRATSSATPAPSSSSSASP